MQFHSSGIIAFGTSSVQNRCQRVSCSERAASSSSVGSLVRDRVNENAMFQA